MNKRFAVVTVMVVVALGVLAQVALPPLMPLYRVDRTQIPEGVQQRWLADPEACIAEALAELDEIQISLDTTNPGVYQLREQVWARIASIPLDAAERQRAEDAFLVGARLRSLGSTSDSDPAVWAALARLTQPQIIEP